VTLDVRPLTDLVGAEVHGVRPEELAGEPELAHAVVEALEAHGVLVFRGLNLTPEQQVAFSSHIGDVDYTAGHHPVPGIYRITLDRSKNAAASILRATFHWHVDGCTPSDGGYPQMAAVLSAQAIADRGGETEFASTYAAYGGLTDDEQELFASLRVLHSLEASQRRTFTEPTDEQLARWRSQPTSIHPLIWTHRSGRRSLLVGATTDHVVAMERNASRALLDELLERATAPERVYRHEWAVGDTVIWDNRGVLHRVEPYDFASPREMLRTTILGDEPIQ
jgi:alpha-ketoglutarate-dependent taurine dioxygenase